MSQISYWTHHIFVKIVSDVELSENGVDPLILVPVLPILLVF